MLSKLGGKLSLKVKQGNLKLAEKIKGLDKIRAVFKIIQRVSFWLASPKMDARSIMEARSIP